MCMSLPEKKEKKKPKEKREDEAPDGAMPQN
jgi:hypothetical protein